MATHSQKYAVKNRASGQWYAVDDRGDVVWVTRGLRAEMSLADARDVVASYASASQKRLQIIPVVGSDG